MKSNVKEYIKQVMLGVMFGLGAPVLFGAVVVAGVAIFGNPGSNIVIIEDWSQAVAICEDIQSTQTFSTKEGTFHHRNGVFYTVNNGHIGDPRLLQLVKRATVHCQQWRNQ